MKAAPDADADDATSYSDERRRRRKRRKRGLFRLWLLPSLADWARLPTGRDGVICHCLVLITPLLLLPPLFLVFCAGSETKLVSPLFLLSLSFSPSGPNSSDSQIPQTKEGAREGRLIFMGGRKGELELRWIQLLSPSFAAHAFR